MTRSTSHALVIALACALAACDVEDEMAAPWPGALPTDLDLGEELAAIDVEPPRERRAPEAPATTRASIAPGGTAALAGTAGGSVVASTRRSECAGNVAEEPDHVVDVGAETHVALRVTSEGDTTLLVQTADGEWLCNDDFDGLQPAIARTFAPGPLRVWVGTWDAEDAGAPYELAVSTELDPAMPRGEPVIDRLNAVCEENWCASGTAYRFERVTCDGTNDCRVTFTIDGTTGEVTTPGARSSWRDEGLDERFVDALGEALNSR
ncbi:hypothetical protein [Sandaracinus amylolyticus]|uniref:hypothetical protein n=1 Tax=Sandaracinus amylolyticus TaxID=927083 RepID=UPI001F2975D8|nr:hypothetical protein [Sandaracinus amylolyticus]UJR78968.1 Hypothetical protein I5071_10010 [Sandaracinus amylolyticus]